MRPLPMHIHTTYTLAKLDEHQARIEIFGAIKPMKSAAVTTDPRRRANEMVTLREGVTFGSSIIDRESGLPIFSRVQRKLDMRVRVSPTHEYDQQKSIITTVQAFRTQGNPVGAPPSTTGSSPGEIVQTSGVVEPQAPVVNAEASSVADPGPGRNDTTAPDRRRSFVPQP